MRDRSSATAEVGRRGLGGPVVRTVGCGGAGFYGRTPRRRRAAALGMRKISLDFATPKDRSTQTSLHPKTGAPKDRTTQRPEHPNIAAPKDRSTQGSDHPKTGASKDRRTQRPEHPNGLVNGAAERLGADRRFQRKYDRRQEGQGFGSCNGHRPAGSVEPLLFPGRPWRRQWGRAREQGLLKI